MNSKKAKILFFCSSFHSLSQASTIVSIIWYHFLFFSLIDFNRKCRFFCRFTSTIWRLYSVIIFEHSISLCLFFDLKNRFIITIDSKSSDSKSRQVLQFYCNTTITITITNTTITRRESLHYPL